MFGHDKERRLTTADMRAFNRTILIQHGTSLGLAHVASLSDDHRRLTWTILANGLLRGSTTVRPMLVELLLRYQGMVDSRTVAMRILSRHLSPI